MAYFFMIGKIFYRYTAWYKFDLIKTKAMLVGNYNYYDQRVVNNCLIKVLVGEYE